MCITSFRFKVVVSKLIYPPKISQKRKQVNINNNEDYYIIIMMMNLTSFENIPVKRVLFKTSNV